MQAIDYRLTDAYLDPPGESDQWFSEKSIRLPDCFWCYDPRTEVPAVSRLPAQSCGIITFGCLNNYCKINGPLLELWSKILTRVKGSRLMLLTFEGSHRQHALDLLQRHGIAPDRIQFASPCERPKYLELYHKIDIALDPAPCNGHTTTFDCLWMGVPVVTLVGQTALGRAGLSELMNLSLPEWVAFTSEQYIAIAATLAADLPRLAAIRSTLREKIRHSPLMDGPRFARNIESAYRQMWRIWCELK